MIFKNILNRKILLNNNCSHWENERYCFYWEGIIFIKGIKEGIDSLKRFSDILITENLEKACSILNGVFFLIVYDKITSNCYCLVDNVGLFQAFYSDEYVSDSFLELIKIGKYTKEELVEESIVEFFHSGFIHFNKTFFDSIKRITDKQIICISQNERRYILDKNIIDIFEYKSKQNEEDFLNIMKDICYSLKDLKISIDLTGGTDSRLLAVLFDYFGLKFEVTTSGVKGLKEITVADQVAKALSHTHHITYHLPNFSDEILNVIFELNDGLMDIITYHRLFQYQQDRLNRGIELAISGGGGEFYKETLWIQDFPFYNRRKSNINRLINSRIIIFKPRHLYLNDRLKKISNNLLVELYKNLLPFKLKSNTRTYDNICYNYFMKVNGSRILTNHNRYMKSYAPLLDPYLLRIGVNLPVKDRFFSNFYRKIITRVNPNVACIPTSESGISMSSQINMIPSDIIKYTLERLERITRLISRKISRKSPFFLSPNNQALFDTIRDSRIMQQSIELLKDEKILAKELQISDIDNDYIGRIVTLAKLIESLY